MLLCLERWIGWSPTAPWVRKYPTVEKLYSKNKKHENINSSEWIVWLLVYQMGCVNPLRKMSFIPHMLSKLISFESCQIPD